MTNEGKFCPKDYERNQACYAYFNKIFNDFRYDFNQYNANGFKNEIDKIDDPILRHIALYLVENYHAAKIYFNEDGKWKNNYACVSLNKWLDNKKSYFTHALHCKGNVHLWNKTIEPLWKILVEKSKENSNNNGNNKKSCERHNFFRGELQLPEELNSHICYKHVPKDYKCVLPFPPNMCNLANTCNQDHVKKYYNECKNNGNDFSDFTKMINEAIVNGNSLFRSIVDITFSRQVQKNIECPSLEFATPISFTPIGSKISYRGINKKRLRDNFNEELEFEEYARSINKNPHQGRRRNNIYYDSVMN